MTTLRDLAGMCHQLLRILSCKLVKGRRMSGKVPIVPEARKIHSPLHSLALDHLHKVVPSAEIVNVVNFVEIPQASP